MKYKGLVFITGVNLKESKRIFKKTKSDLIKFNGLYYKPNAAAGTAIVLNKKGYLVFIVGSDNQALKILSAQLKGSFYAYASSLEDEVEIKKIVNKLYEIKQKTKLSVHLVYYGSASDTKIELPENSIFLDPWNTPPVAMTEIVSLNIFKWLHIMQHMRFIFEEQKITKVIVITAVAAVRVLPLALIDNVQKGAVHAMARSFALDLTRQNIYVTEVMPGTTDTGFYDNDFTLNQTIKQGREYGYEYNHNDFPIFSGQKVGAAVHFALDSGAYIREISMVAQGQLPHLGA